MLSRYYFVSTQRDIPVLGYVTLYFSKSVKHEFFSQLKNVKQLHILLLLEYLYCEKTITSQNESHPIFLSVT